MKIFGKVEMSKEKMYFIKKNENNHDFCGITYFDYGHVQKSCIKC